VESNPGELPSATWEAIAPEMFFIGRKSFFIGRVPVLTYSHPLFESLSS